MACQGCPLAERCNTLLVKEILSAIADPKLTEEIDSMQNVVQSELESILRASNEPESLVAVDNTGAKLEQYIGSVSAVANILEIVQADSIAREVEETKCAGVKKSGFLAFLGMAYPECGSIRRRSRLGDY
jgi:hypothetical protein